MNKKDAIAQINNGYPYIPFIITETSIEFKINGFTCEMSVDGDEVYDYCAKGNKMSSNVKWFDNLDQMLEYIKFDTYI